MYEFVIVRCIKISTSTSTEILYAGFNHRSLNATIPIDERIIIS